MSGKESTMSKNDSVAVSATASKDNVLTIKAPGVLQLAQADTQKTVATVVDVQDNGGFSKKATLGELIEFQFTGLLVVFTVLGGLTLLCVLIAKILKVLAPDQYYGKSGSAPETPAKPVAAAVQPLAAVAAKTIHPGLSDEKFISILSVAAQEAVGQAVSVVKFRHMGSMDWTWSVQGRVGIHNSHKR